MKIFEDFRQVDQTPRRAYGGTGLGLSICRRLTTMLRGTLKVESKLGHGSVFTLTLPTNLTEIGRPVSRLPEGAMKEAMATKNKSEPLVLVVDDFADAREMYGEYLKFCGFRVAEAQNGVEAIDKAKRLKPDLILMDLSMPVVDGWEATRRLKADASTKGIPVVALTGHAMAGHSESAKSAGCDVVITKPCLPHDLIKEIKKVIGTPAAKDGKAKRTSA